MVYLIALTLLASPPEILRDPRAICKAAKTRSGVWIEYKALVRFTETVYQLGTCDLKCQNLLAVAAIKSAEQIQELSDENRVLQDEQDHWVRQAADLEARVKQEEKKTLVLFITVILGIAILSLVIGLELKFRLRKPRGGT